MKTVLITGASSGIGKALAFEFATHNYNLVLVARRKELLDNIKQRIKQKHSINIDVVTMDLATLDAAERLVQKITEQHIEVDVLINNAGFGILGELQENNIERIESMLILNIITLTKLSRLFAAEMIKKGTGNIINIASTAAFQPVPKLAAYAATKSYVMNFSDAIAYELKDKNIKVLTVSPGATQSEFGSTAGFGDDTTFFNKMPSSEDLAKFTYKAMSQQKTNVIHGLKNRIMAFSNRFAPRKIAIAIAAMMMK